MRATATARWRSASLGGAPLVALLVLASLSAGSATAASAPAARTASTAAARSARVAVYVKGRHLVNAVGKVTRLLGVDRSGTEYACEQGWGIFDGPATAPSVEAMVRWHVNAVRLPLNEGCWLDLFTTANDPYDNGRNPAPFEGGAYRTAIRAYVELLHAHGMAVILSLHALDARTA